MIHKVIMLSSLWIEFDHSRITRWPGFNTSKILNIECTWVGQRIFIQIFILLKEYWIVRTVSYLQKWSWLFRNVFNLFLFILWLWKLSIIITSIMVYKCSVPNGDWMVQSQTGSSQDQSSEKISVHKFPTDPSILNEWMKAIPRKDWIPSCHSIVCSHHFDE